MLLTKVFYITFLPRILPIHFFSNFLYFPGTPTFLTVSHTHYHTHSHTHTLSDKCKLWKSLKSLFDKSQLLYSLQAFWISYKLLDKSELLYSLQALGKFTIPTMLAEIIKSAPFSTWKYKQVKLLWEIESQLKKVFSKSKIWTLVVWTSSPMP